MDSAGRRHRMWMKFNVIVAVVSLFLMALLSSLGDAFVYIFSGLSIFFFFQAWMNSRLIKESEPGWQQQRRWQDTRSSPSFAEQLRSFLQSIIKGQGAGGLTPKGKQMALILSSVIGGFVMLVMIVSVFSGGSDSVDDAYYFRAQGDDYYNRGLTDSAFIAYRRSVLVDPSLEEGFIGLGNLKTQQRQFDSAMYYYNHVLELNPERNEAVYGKALVYYEQQDYDRSMHEVRDILARSGSDTYALLLAGDNYYVTNKYDSAIGYYESAYNLGARSRQLMHIMAYIYDTNGDQARAIQFYKETLEYDTTLTDVYRRLGELIPGEAGNYYRNRSVRQQ